MDVVGGAALALGKPEFAAVKCSGEHERPLKRKFQALFRWRALPKESIGLYQGVNVVSAEIAELVVRVEYEAALESTVRLLEEAAEIR